MACNAQAGVSVLATKILKGSGHKCHNPTWYNIWPYMIPYEPRTVSKNHSQNSQTTTIYPTQPQMSAQTYTEDHTGCSG